MAQVSFEPGTYRSMSLPLRHTGWAGHSVLYNSRPAMTPLPPSPEPVSDEPPNGRSLITAVMKRLRDEILMTTGISRP